MAKRIIRPPARKRQIKNASSIGAGAPFTRVKNPNGSTNWRASVQKQAGKAPARPARKRAPRPNAPTFKPQSARPIAKASPKRQVRPPGAKAQIAPVKRPPTIKKAPRISRGPKR